MIDESHLPASAETILVTRLDALGDIVLGTMLLSGLHAKWPDARIQLLVRPQMAGVAMILPDWVDVRPLPFDPRESVIGHEERIAADLRDFAAQFHPDLAIVAEYNRVWAGEILAGMSQAPAVFAFDGPTGLNAHHRAICHTLDIRSQERWQTVHVEADSREPAKYAAFLDALGVRDRHHQPSVVVHDNDRATAAALWEQAGLSTSLTTGAPPEETLLFFPGSGDRFSRSLQPGVWSRWIARLAAHRPVVLLGSALDEPVLDAIAALGLPAAVSRVIVPVEQIGVTAAFLEKAGAYIGMDTGPTHLAAALGRPTLSIFGGGHRAERFLPVGHRAAAVRMPISCYGCDWICPFERRLCIKDIPEQPLFAIGEAFLQDTEGNADPFAIRVFDIAAPPSLPDVVLGPVMLQHRRFLQLNHDLTEHHAYLAALHVGQQAKVEELTRMLGRQDEMIGHLSSVIAEMTAQNRGRDEAIAHLSNAISEMTRQNTSRDDAIAHHSGVIAEMSSQNQSRDGAIEHINKTLAEMTLQNNSRDQAIAMIAEGRKNAR